MRADVGAAARRAILRASRHGGGGGGGGGAPHLSARRPISATLASTSAPGAAIVGLCANGSSRTTRVDGSGPTSAGSAAAGASAAVPRRYLTTSPTATATVHMTGGGGGSGGEETPVAAASTVVDDDDDGTTEESSSSWTQVREDNLRSALLGNKSTDADADSTTEHLSKEMRLLVSSLSSRNAVADGTLMEWIKLAERYAAAESAASPSSPSSSSLSSSLPSRSRSSPYQIIPYESAISSLLSASSSHPHLLLNADTVMDQLLQLWEDGQRTTTFRTVNDLYGHLVMAWARCRHDDVGRLGGRHDGRKKRYGERRRRKRTPGEEVEEAVGEVVPADRCEAWLRRWVDHVQRRRRRAQRDEVVQDALGGGEQDDDDDDDDDDSGSPRRLGPKALVFGAAIDAHAKSRRMGAAVRAERVLEWLVELRRDAASGGRRSNDKRGDSSDGGGNDDDVDDGWWRPPIPNAVMYTSVMDGWAKSAHHVPDASAHAERWLAVMEREYYEYGVEEARPGVLPYGAVIMAHARSGRGRGHGRGQGGSDRKDGTGRAGRGGRDRDRDRADDGDNPAVRAENVLIRILSRNEELIRKAAMSSLGGKESSSEMVSSATTAAAVPGVVQPDINVYNGIIDAWARQVGRGGGRTDDMACAARAEGWLSLLLGRSDDDDLDFSDARGHGRGHGSNGKRERQARNRNNLQLLRPLIAQSDVVPDVVTFNTVINAYCRIRASIPAVNRAEEWLRTMRETQMIEPTSITYGSIIKGWANTRSSVGAVEATRYLEQYERAGREGKLVPNAFVYNAVMNAWADSGRADKLKHMATILHRMERCWDGGKGGANGSAADDNVVDDDVGLAPPDQITYNSFLKGCSQHVSLDATQAFSSLLSVLDKVTGWDDRIREEPDYLAFLSTLSCISRCVPSPQDRSDPRYVDLCRTVFVRCCHHGLVSGAVLETLRSALGPDPDGSRLYRDIVVGAGGRMVQGRKTTKSDGGSHGRPGDGTDVDVPKEWRRNLREKDRARATGRTHGFATKVAAEKSRTNRVMSRRHLPR